MIRILTLVAAFAAATPALAFEKTLCPTIGEAARLVMESRQSGISMDVVMDIFSEDHAVHEFGRQMVIVAYGMSRYDTERMQEKAITEFGNTVMHICYDR